MANEEKPKKKKFDPSTLAPELREVYDKMLADYTRKTQALAEKEAEYKKQIDELNTKMLDMGRAMQYYETVLLPQIQSQTMPEPSAVDMGGAAGFNGQLPFELRGPDHWDPFDNEAVRAAIGQAIAQYHNYLTREWQGFLRGLTELQTYNFQLMKLMARHPDLDVNKVIALAPQYGNNLELAARALTEAPAKYAAAERVPELQKELENLRTRLKEMEAKGTPTSILGGTTGPVPRTVARGQTPRTYEEVAATISPAEIFAPTGSGGTVAGTSGAGGGGASGPPPG